LAYGTVGGCNGRPSKVRRKKKGSVHKGREVTAKEEGRNEDLRNFVSERRRSPALKTLAMDGGRKREKGKAFATFTANTERKGGGTLEIGRKISNFGTTDGPGGLSSNSVKTQRNLCVMKKGRSITGQPFPGGEKGTRTEARENGFERAGSQKRA